MGIEFKNTLLSKAEDEVRGFRAINQQIGGTFSLKGGKVNVESWINQKVNEAAANKWRAERQALIDCKNSLEKKGILITSYLEGWLQGFMQDIIRDHGQKNVETVLATTINYADWDRRYRADVKRWAATVKPFPQHPDNHDPTDFLDFCTNIHPAILDEAAWCFMKEKERRQPERASEKEER